MDRVVELLTNDKLWSSQSRAANLKAEAFCYTKLAEEWEKLFELLGCVIKSRIAIRRKDDIDKKRFYRMNWILAV